MVGHPKISLDEQIQALEITLANTKGTIQNLRVAVKKKQREPVWLEILEQRYPKIESALNTLKWLKKNEDLIRSALTK